MTLARLDPSSFRDPAGFVYRRDGVLLRQVNVQGADDWRAFVASGLARRLIDGGRLIDHEDRPLEEAATPDAHAVIRPTEVDFISYPFEWTFGELRDAALLTLDIELEALADGWTLKDASGYNVAFHEGRPIFIDSLSFEPHPEGTPWVAYRQFCQHFLAPLALMARRDIRLSRLLRADPEGVPLDLAVSLLPWTCRLDFGLLSHLYLHARAQRRHATNPPTKQARAHLSGTRLVGLVKNLRSTVARLEWRPAGTEWADYADHTSYSDAASAAKLDLVDALARRVPGEVAWDLGANTGRYSRVIADTGKQVFAFDIDPAAAEQHYRQIRRDSRTDILPLVLDVANPSPGLGWGGKERAALTDRAAPDFVVALALIHHLAIGRNAPLAMILDLFADLAPWSLVEFVGKDDPMVQRLLATRKDVFPDHTIEGFRAAASARHEIAAEARIPESGRVLFLLRRVR